MPDFDERTRARLHNDVLKQLERVVSAPSAAIARDRRFMAFGVIFGMTKAGALGEDTANELLAALQVTDPPEVGAQFEAALREALFDPITQDFPHD